MKHTISTSALQGILNAVDASKLFDNNPATAADYILLLEAIKKAGNRIGKDILLVDIN